MIEYWKILSVETLPGEIWKNVKGYEGLYEVSNLGRIKSLSKPFFGKPGKRWNRGMMPDKILSSKLGTAKGKEYIRLSLCNNGQTKHKSVHRLVDIDFPINMAKPIIMEATSRAMAMKIFDQFGVFPSRRKDDDPVIIGQIITKNGYLTKTVSFMIAWHINTNVL